MTWLQEADRIVIVTVIDKNRWRGIMKIEYDKEVDALYIRIQEKKAARTKEVEEG